MLSSRAEPLGERQHFRARIERATPGQDRGLLPAVQRRDARSILRTRGQRTFAVVLATGDDVMTSLAQFAKDKNITAAQFTAIGALSDAVLMYFDWEKEEYKKIPVAEQVEVAALIGDVAEAPSGGPALHAHIVVGKRDGSAMAGHLGEAHVRPTLEVIMTESPAHLRKVKDPQSGLALIQPSAS